MRSQPAGAPLATSTLEQALGTAGVAVLVVEPDGTVARTNRAATELWRLGQAELVGTKVSSLFSTDLGHAIAAVAATSGDDDPVDPVSLTIAVVAGDGCGIPVDVRIVRLVADSGSRVLVVAQERSELDTIMSRLRQLEKALETMQVGVTITDVDRKILYVNPAEARMHGYTPDELLGRHVSIFAPPYLHQPLGYAQVKTLRTWRRESVNLRKDGAVFPVEMLSDAVLDDNGDPEAVVSICRDITARKQAEQALHESEERYALALLGSNDGIWDWDLRTGTVFYSNRWRQMLGSGEGDLEGSVEEWWERVHPEDIDQLRHDIEVHRSGQSTHFENEHRMLHGDGSYRWMLSRGLAIRDHRGNAYRMAGSQSDITDRKVRDPLTQLPNRALFLDRLSGALGRARRHRRPSLAVLYLDLDRFRGVNDSLGHRVGDRLLVEVARELLACIRPGDMAARLGGDEFAVLLEELRSHDDAERVAQRVLRRLNREHRIAGHDLFAAASIGIAVYDQRYSHGDPEALVRDADVARYAAKELGGCRYQVFDEEMRKLALDRLRIETELRQALEQRQLVVHYQPIVTIDSQEIVGFEALVRWAHPRRGLLPPSEFISVAEETGLIVELGRWVLEEACGRLGQWRQLIPDGDRLTISVNVSARQLSQPDLVQQVQSILDSVGLAPHSLKLEITESLFIHDEKTVSRLRELRSMGVQVCIDDFGTGYSSLSYLQRLPVDGLKIDRSFITRLENDDKTVEMVRTILRLAAELDLEVIAEGVERRRELDTLRKLSCAYMQGFNFSEPLAQELIPPLLRHRPQQEPGGQRTGVAQPHP